MCVGLGYLSSDIDRLSLDEKAEIGERRVSGVVEFALSESFDYNFFSDLVLTEEMKMI